MASIITITSMVSKHVCTYKVMSSTGAPGFQIDAREFPTLEAWYSYNVGSRPNVEAGQEDHPQVESYFSDIKTPAMLMYWVEYELGQVTVYEDLA